MQPLEILYADQWLTAINKPHGLLVHRTSIAADADTFAVQLLRDQINKKVFPCHRIDRKTSGLLLFALDNETNGLMQQKFAEGKVEKKYLAIVRGFTPNEQEIDYPLKDDRGNKRPARTLYRTLFRTELPLPSHNYPGSRYSLIEVYPKSGRMHQIRRHMAHIFHPIIGDRPHGCNKQNKLFKEHFNMTTMLLHAADIKFVHPVTGLDIRLNVKPSKEFIRMCNEMNWNSAELLIDPSDTQPETDS